MKEGDRIAVDLKIGGFGGEAGCYGVLWGVMGVTGVLVGFGGD